MKAAPFFGVHPGHLFEGFELADGRVVARCSCGAELGTAPAAYRACPECGGTGAGCSRCGGEGRVVDHAALVWRISPSSVSGQFGSSSAS